MFHSVTLLFVAAASCLLVNRGLVLGYGVPEKVFYNLESSESLFQDYLKEHQKGYTDREADNRFEIFKDNLQKINKLNQEHDSAVFGLTPFSDMTLEEFMATVSCVHDTSGIEPAEIPNVQPPEDLDYRNQSLVTPVKDQQRCGSCYIFGAIGDIEGQYAKKNKRLVSLSEQYPLDCNANFTCNGNWPEVVSNWLATTEGAVSMHDYPYTGHKDTCKNNATAVVKVTGAKRSSAKTAEALKTILADHGPLGIALYVSPAFQNYKGGVFSPSDCEGSNVNHAVLLVGYEKANSWIIKNSWGSSWGENGYFRLAFDKCSVGDYLFPSEVA